MTGVAPPAASRRHRAGFWAIAYAFLAVLAFSTAPSPLYVLYAGRDHLSSLAITTIYAAYAVGVVGSLLFASHLSDAHGRRPHLLAAVLLAVVSGVVFIAWPDLAGLFVARILSGVSVGLTVSTATAYLDELHRACHPGSRGMRAQLTATAANLGGLSLGAMVAGILAEYAPHPLVLPYLVLLAALAAAGLAIVVAPETRPSQWRRPYRPQRLSVPRDARPAFAAALVGVFLAYSGPAIFTGLAGTFLATVVHTTSLAMTGATIFVVFTAGVAVLAAIGTWPSGRLLVTGAALDVTGLALVVFAAWLPAPSLVVFLVGGGVVGAAAAALFKGTLGRVVAISPPDRLGETLAGFFLAGYVGLSVPAIAVGVALQHVSARVTLLAFAAAASLGILCTLRPLLGAASRGGANPPSGPRRAQPVVAIAGAELEPAHSVATSVAQELALPLLDLGGAARPLAAALAGLPVDAGRTRAILAGLLAESWAGPAGAELALAARARRAVFDLLDGCGAVLLDRGVVDSDEVPPGALTVRLDRSGPADLTLDPRRLTASMCTAAIIAALRTGAPARQPGVHVPEQQPAPPTSSASRSSGG